MACLRARIFSRGRWMTLVLILPPISYLRLRATMSLITGTACNVDWLEWIAAVAVFVGDVFDEQHGKDLSLYWLEFMPPRRSSQEAQRVQ